MVEAHSAVFVNFNLGASLRETKQGARCVMAIKRQGNLQFEWYRGIIRLIYEAFFYL